MGHCCDTDPGLERRYLIENVYEYIYVDIQKIIYLIYNLCYIIFIIQFMRQLS